MDVYEHGSDFRELSFAARDAKVLQALFEDNVDGETNLSVDRDATKRNFLTEIGHVADRCAPGDLAVISFSGHGTLDGDLVMYDTDPDNLHITGLPLGELLAAVERIPAGRLIVVLDCCFVGGEVGAGPRSYVAKTAGPRTSEHARYGDPRSLEHTIGKFEGDGRVVIAASGKGQVAYEDPRLRHGVLTHYLIQGLLGRGLDVRDGRISLLALAENIMRQVPRNPGTVRKGRQEPVLRASTGLVSIKVFKAGEQYRKIMGGLRPPDATPAFSSLVPHGLPEEVCETWKRRVGKLTDFQVDVIDRGGLLAGDSLLVGAPTSSGKTLLGEVAALKSIAAGRSAVFLVPTRALADEVYERFVSDYAELGITVVRAVGGRREKVPELLAGRFQLAVCTYEKFIGLLRLRPGLLPKIGVLVVDEIQTIGVPVRGPKLELLLTRIRARRRGGLPVPQVIGLSSAPGAGRALAEWAGMTPMLGTERPTPLQEGVVSPGGWHRIREHGGAERSEILPGFQHGIDAEAAALSMVRRLVREGRQVIVFRPRRHEAWTLAGELAATLGLPSAEAALGALPRGDDGRVTERLRSCLRGGVAFHISDLSDAERRVVECSFGRATSEIRVIVATATLAQGVNLPADCVVVHGLERPLASSPQYTVSEYKNMAGRAGRTGQVGEGRAFIIANSEIDAKQKWRDYVQAEPQPLRTAFPGEADDLRTTILSLYADCGDDAGGSKRVDVRQILDLTFASYQHRYESVDSRPFPPAEVDSALRSLCDTRLLQSEESGYRLTGLGAVAVRSGLSVESILTLVRALSEVPLDAMNPMTLICAAQLTAELGDVRFSGGSSKGTEVVRVFDRELQKRGAPRSVLARMSTGEDAPKTFLCRARRAVACYMWSRGNRLVKIEKAISFRLPTEFADPGPVRQAARRAAEVVDTALQITLEVQPDAGELGELWELPTQLEFGVQAGLAPVARYANGAVERHVFLGLADMGLMNASKILDAEDEILLRCAGNDATVFAAVRKAAGRAVEAEAEDDLGGLID
ncbi:DEAD/DEAH box helicase [Actinomadura sp. NEAU-AAG7]|uniref:DEAD/DEAH box helicase n=1 Tax=Actinomadura sp. NEAU-AAG7 TaxID=2839640 RepID=UPI001BE48F2B|nr:DEAD/DEAH box helicase [Actinomadura sp. NEAU-AAG7]MBT2208727.1 DEAD/DEAH box helicase [Actinomadura sp. NEAU-AAG7]